MSKSGRWWTVVRVLLFFISCAVILAGIAPMAPASTGMLPAVFIGVVAGAGAFILSYLFVKWEGVRLEDIGAWPGRRSLPRFAVGFCFGLAAVSFHSLLMGVAGHVRWVRAPEVSAGEIAVAVLAFIALSCREELAFHGFPLRRMEKRFGLWIAQSVVALVFAAEHVAGGATWGQALAGPAVGSLLFGMASIATEGLAVPVGIHAAWNIGDWMRGGKGPTGVWSSVVEKGFEERAQLFAMCSYVLVVLAGMTAFWWWHRRSRIPG